MSTTPSASRSISAPMPSTVRFSPVMVTPPCKPNVLPSATVVPASAVPSALSLAAISVPASTVVWPA